MNWFRDNIKWFGPTVAMFMALVYFAGDFMPMPAKAADLYQLAEIVQQTNDSVQELKEQQEKNESNHNIKHLQNEIANIRLQFIALGKQLSPEAIFYITEKETEIENIRKGEE